MNRYRVEVIDLLETVYELESFSEEGAAKKSIGTVSGKYSRIQ